MGKKRGEERRGGVRRIDSSSLHTLFNHTVSDTCMLHTGTCKCEYMYIHPQTYTHTYTYTYKRVCTCTYIYTCTHTHTHTYTHTHVSSAHISTHAHAHHHTHIDNQTLPSISRRPQIMAAPPDVPNETDAALQYWSRLVFE